MANWWEADPVAPKPNNWWEADPVAGQETKPKGERSLAQTAAVVPRAVAAALPAFNEGLYGTGSAIAEYVGGGENRVSRWLDTRADEAAAVREQWSPEEDTWFGRQVQGAAQSVGGMIPGLAAAALTKNPAFITGAFVAPGAITEGGQATREAQAEGKSAGEALGYGLRSAGAEVAFGLIPAHRLANDIIKGTGFGSMLMRQLAVELPTEVATTVTQNLNTWLTLNPDKPFEDWIAEQPEAIRDTIVQTAMATAAVSGAAGAISRQRSGAQEDEGEDESKVETGEIGADQEAALADEAIPTTPESITDEVMAATQEQAVPAQATPTFTSIRSQPETDAQVATPAPEQPPAAVPEGTVGFATEESIQPPEASVLSESETVPETVETLKRQMQDLLDKQNDRGAVYVPFGSPAFERPRLRAGLYAVPVEGGMLYVDRNKTGLSASDARALAKSGRLNEALGLGPFSKEDVAADTLETGAPQVAVTERTPEGVEVKAAESNTNLAPETIAALEEQAAPENTVQVEPVEQVIGAREAGVPVPPEQPAAEVTPEVTPEPAPVTPEPLLDEQPAQVTDEGQAPPVPQEEAIEELAPPAPAPVETQPAPEPAPQEPTAPPADKEANQQPAERKPVVVEKKPAPKGQNIREIARERARRVASEASADDIRAAGEKETNALIAKRKREQTASLTKEEKKERAEAVKAAAKKKRAESKKIETAEKQSEKAQNAEEIRKKVQDGEIERGRAEQEALNKTLTNKDKKRDEARTEMAAKTHDLMVEMGNDGFRQVKNRAEIDELRADLKAILDAAKERGIKLKGKIHESDADAVVWLADVATAYKKLASKGVQRSWVNTWLMDNALLVKGSSDSARVRRRLEGDAASRKSDVEFTSIESFIDTEGAGSKVKITEQVTTGAANEGESLLKDAGGNMSAAMKADAMARFEAMKQKDQERLQRIVTTYGVDAETVKKIIDKDGKILPNLLSGLLGVNTDVMSDGTEPSKAVETLTLSEAQKRIASPEALAGEGDPGRSLFSRFSRNQQRILAPRIMAALNKIVGDVKIHVLEDAVFDEHSTSATAYYSTALDMIVIRKSSWESSTDALHNVIHEAAHAAFRHTLAQSETIRKQVEKLLEIAQANAGPMGLDPNTYGLTDVHEFVSEAFSNPEFQEFLANLPVSADVRKALGITGPQSFRIKTAFQWFKSELSKILGLEGIFRRMGFEAGTRSMFDTVMDVSGRMMEIAPDARAKFYLENPINLPTAKARSAFQEWFGNSKTVTESGNPMVFYHGTGDRRQGFGFAGSDPDYDIISFKPNRIGLIFGTPDPQFTEDYAGLNPANRPRVYPIFMKADNPFDPKTYDDVSPVVQRARDLYNATHGENAFASSYGQRIKEFEARFRRAAQEGKQLDTWSYLEIAPIIRALKDMGYDGLYVVEDGVKNLAVFEPTQIKSVWNPGTFDPNNPDILANKPGKGGKKPAPYSSLRKMHIPASDAKRVADHIKATYEGKVTDEQLKMIADRLKDEYKAIDAATQKIKRKVRGKYANGPEQIRKRLDEGVSEAGKLAEREFVPTKKPPTPRLLKVLSNIQIGQIGDRYFGRNNPLRRIANLIENRRVRKARYLKDFTPTIQDILASYKNYKPEQLEEFSSLTIAATNANLKITVPLEENKHLSKDGLLNHWNRSQHAKLHARFKALPPGLQDLYVKTRDFYTETQNAMSYKVIEMSLRAFDVKFDDAMVQRFHEDRPTMEDRKAVGADLAHHLEQASYLHKIEGDYFNLARRGRYVVNATYQVTTPANAIKISDNTFDFTDEKEARAWMDSMDLPVQARRTAVDKTTGAEYAEVDGKTVKIKDGDHNAEKRIRVKVQTQHTEFVDSVAEAKRRNEELAAAGLKVKDFEPKRFERVARNAEMLGDQFKSMADTVDRRVKGSDKLSQQQKDELKSILFEVGIRFAANTKVQSTKIPRRKVAGASKDMARNVFEYADSAAGYLAKVDTAGLLAEELKEAEARVAMLSDRGEGYGTGARMLLNEVESRVYRDLPGEDDGVFNKVSQRLTGIAFIDMLLSPAYSIVNASQVGMFTMPMLSGEFGIGKANAAIAKAYYDLGAAGMAGSGLKDTFKALRGKPVTGDHYISDAKALLKEPREQDMIDHLADFGYIDADGGMEIARILDAQETGFSGAVDRTMYFMDNVARALPQGIEAINRTVTALSAYRLHYAKHKDHEAAKRYASDVVNDTQAVMSNSNAAPIFSHPIWRVSLQFKKFGQMAYYMMFKQVGRMTHPMKKGDRLKAAKSMLYFLAATQAVAGTAGLPIEPLRLVSLLAAALGEEWEMDDLNEWIEEQWAEITGSDDLARGLTYGVTSIDGITGEWGVDLNSRLGLDSLLLFGEPRSSDEEDWKTWLFDTLVGPAGRTVQDIGEGVIDVLTGEATGSGEDMAAAVSKMMPVKVLADVARAYKGGAAGDLTVQEMIMKAVGFTSDETSAEYRETGREIRENRQEKAARNDLINQYLNARTTEEIIAARKAVQRWNRENNGFDRVSLSWLNRQRREDSR